MKNISDLKNLRFTVVGGARSGLSCLKLLQYFNLNVFLTDKNELSISTIEFLNEAKIPFEHKGHSELKILENTDVLIISPGLPLNTTLILNAKKNNIPVVSEIEIASWFFLDNIYYSGITGTNGKSTTTNYLSQLLNFHGQSIACGNIGRPLSEVILEIHQQKNNSKPYYLSIELSSYQLECIYTLRPHCTCLLNIQNDHLDRYETIEEYLKAKWRLILLTRDDGLTIIEENVLKQALDLGLALPKCKIIILKNSTCSKGRLQIASDLTQQNIINIETNSNLPISIYKELKTLPLQNLLHQNNVHFAGINYNKEENSAYISFYENRMKRPYSQWNIHNCCLKGLHNVTNLLTATLMAEFLRVDFSFLFIQWENDLTQYVHLPHRMEIISKENENYLDQNQKEKNLTIINDSKATNVESTCVALKSFHKNIRLLVGGQPKGDSYLPLVNSVEINKIKIYPFGKSAPLISNELKEFEFLCAKNSSSMLEAAKMALLDAQDNDVLLLSPACSSFDEFKDYEHRGQVFRDWAISCIKGT